MLPPRIPQQSHTFQSATTRIRLGTVVLARKYLPKALVDLDTILSSGDFVLADWLSPPLADVISSALLHRQYVDTPIIFGSSKKYAFSDRAVVQNIIAPAAQLPQTVRIPGPDRDP